MFIEYKVKFGHNEVTVAQCIDFDDLTFGESEGDRQNDRGEADGTVVAENRLSRAVHQQSPAAEPLPIGGGPGSSPRGSGPGNSPRGSGPGSSPRGSGRLIVLGPVIINFPPPPPPPPPPQSNKE